MDTEGVLAPATAEEARAAHETVGPAARTVVRETARAMGFDREEYRERVTGEVVETARDALFASLLAVRIGTREEYDEWRADYEGEVHETGSATVERVVWHAPPFADRAVAATFQTEREAAAGTLRRQAFGRLYRHVLSDEDPDRGEGTDGAAADRGRDEDAGDAADGRSGPGTADGEGDG